MKLYLKQKMFSIGDKYTVYAENDDIAYTVKSRVISPFRHKKYLMDKDGNIIMIIKRKILDILPNYLIETPDGERLARLQKRFSFRSSFNMKDCKNDYSIKGDFFNWDWTIFEGEEVVGTIHKKIIHLVDSYYMDVIKEEDAPFFVACVIAIDNLFHNGSRSGNR